MCINDLFENWRKRTKASTESSTQKDVCYKPVFLTTHTYEVIGRGTPQIDSIRQIFVNANKDLKDIVIYKYYSFDNLQYVLKDKKLYFDKVKRWEDTYENFLMKNNYYVSNQRMSLEVLVECEYGQSWTTEKESDAMWRLYSKDDKNGVKIKTTVEKLYKALYVDRNSLSNTRIGFVRYCDIDSYLKQLMQNNYDSLVDFYKKEFVKSMFVKRKDFDYEHEFRVIISLDSNNGIADKCERLAYNIDTDLFIDEFCLDPRLKNQEFLSMKKKLTDLGVTETKIIQSKLYDFKVADFQFDKY